MYHDGIYVGITVVFFLYKGNSAVDIFVERLCAINRHRKAGLFCIKVFTNGKKYDIIKEKEGEKMIWWILWLGVALALLAVELTTTELVSIWFSSAALLVGIVTAIFPSLHLVWQMLIFAVCAVGLLILTRPFVKKFLKREKKHSTNLELIIGQTGIVEEDIDNDRNEGAAKVKGIVWNARSQNGEKIPTGTLVQIESLDGNKLIVTKR